MKRLKLKKEPTYNTGFRMPLDLYTWVLKYTEKNHRNITFVIIEAIREYKEKNS